MIVLEDAPSNCGNRALYYRSIAELKFMGFIKPTRKRVDHLQKLAWKGL